MFYSMRIVLLTSLASFSGMQAAEHKNINDHPLMKSGNIRLLCNLADRISKHADAKFSTKKQILVGMGQSPAYLLEAMKLIDEKKKRDDRRYINVAFSGDYYGGRGVDRDLYKKYSELGHHYKNYLNPVGLSQDNLNEKDTEFIVLEVCHHGNGLKSFLSFFNEYRKKPYVIYLQHSLNSAIAAYAQNGCNVIVDYIGYDQKWLQDLQEKCSKYKTYYVQVTIPLDILEMREEARGTSPKGHARSHYYTVYGDLTYDLVVNSGESSAAEIALTLKKLIEE